MHVFVPGERLEPETVPRIRVVDGIRELVEMGFQEQASRCALANAQGDLQVAVTILLGSCP